MPGVLQDAEMDPDVEILDQDTAPTEPYVVLHQEVTLEINFREKSIQGESKIKIWSFVDDLDEITIDARQCEIDTSKITVKGKNVEASYRDAYESLDIPSNWDITPQNYPVWKNRIKNLALRNLPDTPAMNRTGCTPCDGNLRINLKPKNKPESKSDSRPEGKTVKLQVNKDKGPPEDPNIYEVVIPFRTTHIRDGLHFVGVEDWDTRFPHAYTRHSIEPGNSACLFPCIDDRGARCMWKVHIKLPKTLGDAMKQLPAAQQIPNGASGARDSGKVTRELVLTETDKMLDMTVVCSGNLIGEKDDETNESQKIMTFEINDHSSAAHHVGFAVGPFVHVNLFSGFRTEMEDDHLQTSALKLHGYCLPGRETEVETSCAAMAQAADYFAMTFGKFPFDSYKMCFVDDMIGDTVPLHSFSLCSTRLLYPEEVIDTEIDVLRKLVHALACQYFGVFIVANELSDMWLTVGIPYYMTDLYLSKLCGNNDYRFRIKTMSDKLVEEDRNRPSLHDLGKYLHLGDFEEDFMALKAPLVLFILDKRVSKTSGSTGASLARVINKVVQKATFSMSVTNENEVLTSEGFRKRCENVFNTKLETFWNQWVKGSGCPYLDVSQKFNKKQLCVEVSVNQSQVAKAAQPRPIPKDDFWRELLEEQNHVYAGNVQPLFTGPMTIRIHEANGTPYEHIVEIREDAIHKGVKFPIPYNTKYKRLKRSRRQRERAAQASALDPNAENPEETIYYTLGDKLETEADFKRFELAEWTPNDEAKMDQESYEWIRVDSDFEWISSTNVQLPPWMFLSQLQQDKDVAAQQDTLLYLARLKEHAMSASILTKTLYDDRYFHGLRTLAADFLSRQTLKERNESGEYDIDHRGLKQLIGVFQEFFCYKNESTPLPNDFSDKRQYHVQSAIVAAISQVQYSGKHPREAQRFLLEQLEFNNNVNNEYSDHFYIATLVQALATSLTSINAEDTSRRKGAKMAFSFGDDDDSESEEDEDMMDIDDEKDALLSRALAQIERYRSMDEWSGSYQNIFTRAALEAKRILMKAGVIPVSAIDFVKYCQDGNLDVVQITAFEALIDLGLMLKPIILKLLLGVMSTHPSPYMRDQLFKRFVRGLAAIAFGEHSAKPEPPKELQKQAAEEDDGGLIIEAADDVIEQVKIDHARRENIEHSLKALKDELKDNEPLQQCMWDALQSPILGMVEKRNLLEIMEVLFEGDLSLLITLKHPSVWTCKKDAVKKGTIHFKKILRPLREGPPPVQLVDGGVIAPPPIPAAIAAAVQPVPSPDAPRKMNKIKLQIGRSSLGSGGPATPGGSTPATPSIARSASVAGILGMPAPAAPPVQDAVADSITAQPRKVLPVAPPPPPPAQAATSPSASRAPTPGGKRKRDDEDSASPVPAKRASTPAILKRKQSAVDDSDSEEDMPLSKKRKLVRFMVSQSMRERLQPPKIRTWLENGCPTRGDGDSIRASHPALSRNASGSPAVDAAAAKPARKPLPGAKGSGGSSPQAPQRQPSVVGNGSAASPTPPPGAAPAKKVIKISVKKQPSQPPPAAQ